MLFIFQSPMRYSSSLCIAGFVSLAILLSYHQAHAAEKKPGANQPIPVTAATAQQQSMPVWIEAQGTVLPLNYVNVMPRVASLLKSVNFREGQSVKAGQLLATLDPEPYQVLLDQAKAQTMRDQAQLDGAQADLQRYETLLAQDSISEQQAVDQRATVAQLKGTVAADKAAQNNAQMQLGWTRITSPLSGIVGLRQVSAGNIVGTAGAIGGGNSALSGTAANTMPIVTVAEIQPIAALFPIAQTELPAVLERMHENATLFAEAWDQRRSAVIDKGKVIAIDNQINSSTGTAMLKAEFPNARRMLFPNQFVNIRLLVNTVKGAVVVPTSAIATGAPGSYVYVIDNNNKVALRKVVAGATDRDYTAVMSGLKAGERVVTDGLDRLRDGSQVQVVQPEGQAAHPHREQGS